MLEANHYGAILVDPPWHFKVWDEETGSDRSARKHYGTMGLADIAAIPVHKMAAPNCVLFMWICWPLLPEALQLINLWGFKY